MAKKTSKRYRAAETVGELSKACSMHEALDLLSKMPQVRFNETVELSVALGVDPKQSDHMIRGVVQLPHGSGKKVRVLVFTEDPATAQKAGADYAGLEDLMTKIEEGWLEFDVALATSSAMKEVRRLARILGPRGLMPSPKSGTVTDDMDKAVKEVKAGRVEFKMDKAANVSIVVGKRSFQSSELVQNIEAAIKVLLDAQPKGCSDYIKKLVLSSTMSPGILLDKKQLCAV